MTRRSPEKFRFSSGLLASMKPTDDELEAARTWAASALNPMYWTPRQVQHVMAGYIARMREE